MRALGIHYYELLSEIGCEIFIYPSDTPYFTLALRPTVYVLVASLLLLSALLAAAEDEADRIAPVKAVLLLHTLQRLGARIGTFGAGGLAPRDEVAGWAVNFLPYYR